MNCFSLLQRNIPWTSLNEFALVLLLQIDTDASFANSTNQTFRTSKALKAFPWTDSNSFKLKMSSMTIGGHGGNVLLLLLILLLLLGTIVIIHTDVATHT